MLYSGAKGTMTPDNRLQRTALPRRRCNRVGRVLDSFTVIRHRLYRTDQQTFSKALSKIARESFDEWLAAQGAMEPISGRKGGEFLHLWSALRAS